MIEPYYRDSFIKLYNGDVLTILKQMSGASINCVVTSPPYWGLRDYGINGQFGLEKTPEEYVNKLVRIFGEVRRILKKDGVVWLNLGDSYWGGGFGTSPGGDEDFKKRYPKQASNKGGADHETRKLLGSLKKGNALKPKDLVGIPWMTAFALRADGWYLRQDIIWNKPNPMPESVKDRCTKSHEYIFLLTKSAKYFYDADAIAEKSIDPESYNGRRPRNAPTIYYQDSIHCKNFGSVKDGKLSFGQTYENRNKRSVWIINTQSFSEAHFAVFPEKIPEICIKAGCPKDGTVLDPFSGSGTTGLVAKKLNRKCILIDLKKEYCDMSIKRFNQQVLDLSKDVGDIT